ncbi:MAG: ATP-binding protein [Planctomycetaceae bacterium]
MKTEPASVRSHPAYHYNELALQLAACAAIVAAGVVLFSNKAPVGLQLSVGHIGLAAVFAFCRFRLLPRVQTAGQLDAVVTVAVVSVFAIQIWSVVLHSGAESPAGVACLTVTISLLYCSTTAFLCTVATGAGLWLMSRQMAGGSRFDIDLVHLFVTAPACAIVVRMSVLQMFGALNGLRETERQTRADLEATVATLTVEKQLRQQSENQLFEVQKNESLGLMAGGIAHDFNNVIQAISSFAEVIQMTSGDQQARQTATEIAKAAANAGDICAQMLVFAGKSQDRHELTDLGTLTLDLQALLRAAVHDNITLTVSRQPNVSLSVPANPGQIRQVLINLVSNAADATRENGGNVSVHVRRLDVETDADLPSGRVTGNFSVRGPCVAIEVTDDGIGIDSEILRQMFDPYFTTKPTGHGFGLSVVLGIVRSHNATIFVNTVPGRGSTVTMLLPCRDAATKQNHRPADSATERPVAATRRILIVDDEESVRRSVARMLTALNWQTVEVSDGSTAIELLQSDRRFDVILLDYTMPHTSGLEVASLLRHSGISIPLILCSGFVDHASEPGLLEIADAFLAKPFQSSELIAVLDQVLQGSR